MLGGESGRRALPLRGAAKRIHSRATGRRRGAGDRLPRAFQTGVVWVAPAGEKTRRTFLRLSRDVAVHRQHFLHYFSEEVPTDERGIRTAENSPFTHSGA